MHVLQIYGHVCRVCFSKRSNLLNINEANEEFSLTILEMLHRTVPALAEFVDFPVPQELCEMCREQLQIAYRFQQICMATNEEIYKLWKESLKADNVGEVKVLLNQHQPNGNDVGDEEKEQEIGVHEELDAGGETDPIKLEPSLIELDAATAHTKCDEYQLPQHEDIDKANNEPNTGIERADLRSFASCPLFRCTFCLKSCRTKDILQQHIKQWHQECVTNRSHHHEDDEDDNKPLITLRKRKKQLNDEHETDKYHIMKEDNESRIDDRPINITSTSSHHCPNCNKTFKYAHHLSKHQCTANSRRQYICELCSKQFTSSNMLQKHMKSKHKEEKGLATATECQQPKDVQDNVKTPSPTLRHHVKNKHSNLPISTENSISDEPDGHSNEFQETDSSNSDNDAGDDEDAEIDSDYTEKKQSPSKSKTLPTGKQYPCTECNAIFRFGKQLERHMKKHTDAHRFVCLVCSDRFKYPFMLQKHVEKHHPEEKSSKPKAVDCKKPLAEKSHICNYCPSAYTNVGGLAQHMSKKHPEIVPFKCDKCDKTFVVEEHLKIHTNRHMGIKNFKCDHCDKSFSFKFAMKQHMRIHTGDLNYLCTLCGKKFYRPSNLRQHMQRHGDDKPYTCPHCPKRFKCPSDRYIHLMSHQEGKNHVCSTCGARFSRVDTLHQHQILHTGEKPYKCDQCPMAFPRLMNLNRHLRTHTGEKPYKCKYCDKAYAQSNDLNKHVRTHVGENTYMCTQCPAAFKYQAELRTHEWDHYRKQKEQEETHCSKGESPADDIEMIEYASGEQIK